MEFRLWGQGKTSELENLPNKREYAEYDASYLMGRRQLFEQEGCSKETIHLVDILLDYMVDKKLRKIKLRADHYLVNDQAFRQMMKAGKI